MVTLLCLASGASASPAAGTAAPTRPNVLFIAVDDLKPLTGWYGSRSVRTPTLDALARQSVVFSRAYTQYPVCGPSRTSLLTGLRPESNGVIDLKTRMRDVNPDIVTLPQYFRQHGYQTAASGKVFDPRNVDSRAADDPASWSIPYEQPRGIADEDDGRRLAGRAIDAPAAQFVDGDINRRGIELLRRLAAGDQPFFLAVGYKKPHLPFDVPKAFYDLYRRDDFVLEPFQSAPAGSDASYILSDNNELRSYHPTPPTAQPVADFPAVIPPGQQQELIHGYHAAVSFIDSLLAELLRELEATGKADSTIIVLWGDHGFHLGDHGMWGKHTTMEQANRVPLLVRVPGRRAGEVVTPVELLDLFPTLVELAGLPMPAGLQGRSIAGLTDAAAGGPGRVAISQYKRQGAYGYSMRTARHRYTEWVTADGKVVYRDLYDMEQDPGETVNLGARPGNDTLMADMAALLRRHATGLERLQRASRAPDGG